MLENKKQPRNFAKWLLLAVLIGTLISGTYQFANKLNTDIKNKKEIEKLEIEKLKLEIILKKIELSENSK